MFSLHWGIFSTLGDIQYIGGIHYIGGCSVHWGNIMSTPGVLSTLEGTMSASGREDIMNTLLDVQYIGGYHDACGVKMSTWGDVQYIRGYHEYIGGIISTSRFSIEIERIYQVAPPHAS